MKILMKLIKLVAIAMVISLFSGTCLYATSLINSLPQALVLIPVVVFLMTIGLVLIIAIMGWEE